MSKKIIAAIAIPSSLFLFNAYSADLSLQAYLDQVQKENPTFIGSFESQKSVQEKSAEASIALMPYLLGTYTNSDDKKETAYPSLYGDRTRIHSYSFGVAKKFVTGTSLSYSFNQIKTDIHGTTPATTAYYTASNTFALTQSLWKDFFGHTTRAQLEAAESLAASLSYQEEYKREQILFSAEMAYWKLSLAQAKLKYKRSTLDRTQKLVQWNKRRVRDNLADSSDLLQSQAAEQLRLLEIQIAEEEFRSASSEFNTLRGISGEDITDDLAAFDGKFSDTKIEVGKTRKDFLAAEQDLNTKRALKVVGQDAVSPDIQATLSYALNGFDRNSGTTRNESWKKSHDTKVLSVKASIPFDWFTIQRVRSAYHSDVISAEKNFEKKRLDLDRERTDLQRRIRDGLKKVELSTALEAAQKNKLDRERERFERGRSTISQVLTFEEDFSQAQLRKIESEIELKTYMAQAKFYH